MGAPFNQLQQISVDISSREIGVDKFHPYTFGSEVTSSNFSLSGILYGGPRDSGKLDLVFKSGSFFGNPKDSGIFSFNLTGDFFPSDGDANIYNFILSGDIVEPPYDVVSGLSVIISGEWSGVISDINEVNFAFSGNWLEELRETGNFSVTFPSGNILGVLGDNCDVDLFLFTGTYVSGFMSFNRPITGEDLVDLNLFLFTGSYQG
jgi:hypothetical protein